MTHLVASFTVFEIVAGGIVLGIILEQRRRIAAVVPLAIAIARGFGQYLADEIARNPAAVEPPKVSASGRVLPSRRAYDGSLETSEVLRMPPTLQLASIAAPLADFVVAELDANKASILAELAAGETKVETLLATGLKALPRPTGFLSLVTGPVDSAIEKYANALVERYGPEVIFSFMDLEAHQFAKELGG